MWTRTSNRESFKSTTNCRRWKRCFRPRLQELDDRTLPAVFGIAAVGADAGSEPRVNVFNLTGDLQYSFLAYPSSFGGGVRVAMADVNNDSVPDIITAPGVGGGPHIKVFNGLDGTLLSEFFAYDATFRGGILVAAGVNATGGAEIITGTGAGGGPHVKVFAANGQLQRQFFAYDAGFVGGVAVAAGDVNRDGQLDIIAGAGAGGGPHVRVFDGATGKVDTEFFAYGAGFQGGVWVAAGDVTGDGRADVITGPGSSGGPHVRVFDSATGRVAHEYYAYDAGFSGGVRVGYVPNDGLHPNGEIITGSGPGGGPHVKLIDPATGKTQDEWFAFPAKFTGGVFVAGAPSKAIGKANDIGLHSGGTPPTPAPLQFTTTTGDVPPPQSFVLSNTDPDTPMTYVITSDDPDHVPLTGVLAGTLLPGAATVVPVTPNPTGLPPGPHTYQVRTICQFPQHPQQTILITIIVVIEAAPIIDVSPVALVFPPVTEGDTTSPAAKTVTIRNAGPSGSHLRYWVTHTESGAGFGRVHLSGDTGVQGSPLGAGQSGQFTVAVDTRGLAAGTYHWFVTVSDQTPVSGTAATNSPVVIPITVVVNPRPVADIWISPGEQPGFQFTVSEGHANPVGVLTVGNVGSAGSSLDFTLATDSSGRIHLGKRHDIVAAGGTSQIAVEVDISGLPPGSPAFAGAISITSNSPKHPWLLVPVTVNILEEGNPFAGSYTGSYSGTAHIPGQGDSPINGPVALTVSPSGVITVTSPYPGSGTVNFAGQSQFAVASGSGANYSFSGTFGLTSGGGASAHGTWIWPSSNVGSADGTWTVSRI